jgi:antirestriction protein ArdC
MTATTTTPMRELDHRHSDGIDVRLLWNQGDNRVHVAVNDHKTGESFTVEVREGESAAQIFQHPFAYADRGVPATPDGISA